MTRDSELLARYVRDGAQDAFGELVATHLDVVYASARRQMGSAAEADDITQVVFLILTKRAATLRTDVILPAWLLTATWYACQNALRKQRRRRIHEAAASSMRSERVGASVGQPDQDAAPLLDKALRSLRERDRAAVVLHYLQGRDYDQVAAALDTTPEGARKRIARAVARLRDRFAGEGVPFARPAVLGTWLTGAAAATKAPPALVSVIAGGQLAAGGAAATTAAEALRSMAFVAKAKAACAVVIFAAASAGAFVAATSVAPVRNRQGAAVATPVAVVVFPATTPSPLVTATEDVPIVASADAVTFANALLVPNKDMNLTDYTYDLDAAVKRRPDGTPAASIVKTAAAPVSPAPGMRGHIARVEEKWRGKRVEIGAYLRTQGITESADLSVLVWGAQNSLKAASMSGGPLQLVGAHDWRRVAAVLDVPSDAQRIEFAVGLWGEGRVWIDSPTIRCVDETVRLTSSAQWHLLTQFPSKYRLTTDPAQPRNGHATARIDSSHPAGVAGRRRGDCAKLQQEELAVHELRGKRVRISAMMKSDGLIRGRAPLQSPATSIKTGACGRRRRSATWRSTVPASGRDTRRYLRFQRKWTCWTTASTSRAPVRCGWMTSRSRFCPERQIVYLRQTSQQSILTNDSPRILGKA
jgi:RNA polymerase sigma-70 factor (ECF subfamily)